MPKSSSKAAPDAKAIARYQKLAAPIRAQYSPYVEAANALVVASEEDKATAVKLMGDITRMEGITNANRELITVPLNLAKAGAQTVFMPMIKECQDAIAIVKSKILSYVERLEAEKQAAVTLLTAKVESGRLKPETAEKRLALIETSAKSMTTEGGASATIVEREVMVITDESLIPDEFWVIDEVKLRAAWAAAKKAGHPLPAGTATNKVKGVSR